VQAAIRGLAGSEVMTLDLLARIRDSLQLNGLSVKRRTPQNLIENAATPRSDQ